MKHTLLCKTLQSLVGDEMMKNIQGQELAGSLKDWLSYQDFDPAVLL